MESKILTCPQCGEWYSDAYSNCIFCGYDPQHPKRKKTKKQIEEENS